MYIELNDLTWQIANALKDEFEAEITQENGVIEMRFNNGQTFRVQVAANND